MRCGGTGTLRDWILAAVVGEIGVVVAAKRGRPSSSSSCMDVSSACVGVEGANEERGACVSVSMSMSRSSSAVEGSGICSAWSSAKVSGTRWSAVGAGMVAKM